VKKCIQVGIIGDYKIQLEKKKDYFNQKTIIYQTDLQEKRKL
jgi:hypothetical protein